MKTWLIIAAIFVAFAAVMNFVFEGILHVSLLDEAKPFITHPGVVAAVAIISLLASDIFLPIPATIVMVLSGALFGTFEGALISLIGSLLGNWIGFELMHRFGATMCKRFVSEAQFRRMEPLLKRFGSIAIVVSRPVPIMMETLSFLAGLARMPRAVFLAASLAGTVPVCLLYGYAGASSMEMKSVVPALFTIICLPAVGWLIAQRKLVLERRQEASNR